METVPPDAVPRLLVIDACNIARSSCGPKRESVNCAGLLNVIRWLTVRNFEVNAFLPIIYKNKYNANVAHGFILNKLHELGIVSFTPARTARCERPALVNYDDLYVAQMAERHGGCILSGDRFSDILANQQYKELHPVLRDRLNLRFIPFDRPFDMVEVGCDRLYKKEPTFIVERGGKEDVERRLYAAKNSPCYKKCVQRRRVFSEQVRMKLLGAMDDLLDELAEREGIRAVRLEEPPPPSPKPPHYMDAHSPIEETTVDHYEDTVEEPKSEGETVEQTVSRCSDLSLDLSFLDSLLDPMATSSVSSGGSLSLLLHPISSPFNSSLGTSTSPPIEERRVESASTSHWQLPPLEELDLETMAEFLDSSTLLDLWLSPIVPR